MLLGAGAALGIAELHNVREITPIVK